MVGNDIVDLNVAKSTTNWQHQRFLDIVFTKKEQRLIYKSSHPFVTIWQLWSMKESAYKLYTQHHPSRFYKPLAFECIPEDTIGKVVFNDFLCYVNTNITSEYLISEARLKPQVISSEIVRFKTTNCEKQSSILKTMLIRKALKSLPKAKASTIIKDAFGIPRLKVNEVLQPISLSHHGNFGTFVLS